MLNNTANGKKYSSEPLDHALKDLLDMCKQYDDKIQMNRNNRQQQEQYNSTLSNDSSGQAAANATNDNQTNSQIELIPSTFCIKQPIICDNFDKDKRANINSNTAHTMQNLNDHSIRPTSEQTISAPGDGDGSSIERLQQKQCELQSHLDEVLEQARNLEIKQKRKLRRILESGKGTADNLTLISNKIRGEGEDDDDELIEFQQIENELRISELNRQLSNIQEELRLRLYNRLLTNSTSSVDKVTSARRQNEAQHKEQQNPAQNATPSPDRQASAARIDDTTPPSPSTCSGRTTTSNTPGGGIDTSVSNGHANVDHESTSCSQESVLTSNTSTNATSPKQQLDSNSNNNNGLKNNESFRNTSFSVSQLNRNDKIFRLSNSSGLIETTDLDDLTHRYETLTPTTSKESVSSTSKKSSPIDMNNIYNNEVFAQVGCQANNTVPASFNTISMFPTNLRNSSANSDLERIEEDEEDGQDFYCNSDTFRTIYEEKLSPLIKQAGALEQFSYPNKFNSTQEHRNDEHDYIPESKHGIAANYHNNSSIQSNHDQVDSSANHSLNSGSSAINTEKCNRPLTIYLPKPDEDIELVEHIQALGHDLDIISADLKLNSISAHGYLYKSCLKNSKKWLKRYFYFDRNSKTLSYYKYEGQLVKKNYSPKVSISFEDISDVYVDHKLSSISEKERGFKGRSVFVLATLKRKYLLATTRAETMRAWIDILFTAAKANDYLHQLNVDENPDQSKDVAS